MSKKNRPNKAPVQNAAPAPQPVMPGNVFVAFLREATSLGNEVEARRSFDNDVGVYLAEKRLVEDFEAWRKARHTPPAAT